MIDSDELTGLIMGGIVGAMVGLLVGSILTIKHDDRIIQAREAVAECESTLPRNQTCKYVITAVPEVAE